jgi:hypothetical protein
MDEVAAKDENLELKTGSIYPHPDEGGTAKDMRRELVMDDGISQFR